MCTGEAPSSLAALALRGRARWGGGEGVAASALALYQFNGCPFCVKVRRTLRRLNVPVELRDASGNAEHRQTLLAEGGKIKVPCLRIEEDDQTRWLYESDAINAYLESRFA